MHMMTWHILGFKTPEVLHLIFKGSRYVNLYLVDFNASEAQLSTYLVTKSSMGWLWHRRFGHIRMK